MKKVWKSPYFWASAFGGLAVTGLIGYGVAELVLQAQRQSQVQFVDTEPIESNRFFTNAGEPPIEIRETLVANTPGWIVNKGPIRVTSAYRELFNKDTLVKFAEWVYRELPWGGNGLSLTTLTFTTGTDSNTNSTTLGFHTAARSGSGIYISPDAFETTQKVGQTTIDEIPLASSNSKRASFASAVEKFLATTPFASATSAKEDEFFTAALANQTLPFSNSANTQERLSTNYKPIDPVEINKVFFNSKLSFAANLLQIYNNDNVFSEWANLARLPAKNFLTVPKGATSVSDYIEKRQTKWTQALKGNYFEPGVAADTGRLIAAHAQQREGDLVRATVPRYAFDTALNLVKAATSSTEPSSTGAADFVSWFLFETLADVFFVPATEVSQVTTKSDGKGQSEVIPTYQLRPVAEWDATWETVKQGLEASYDNPALLKQQEASYKLFKTYYTYAENFYQKLFAAETASLKTFTAWIIDPARLISAYYAKHIANLEAPFRISFLLAQHIDVDASLWITAEDERIGLASAKDLASPQFDRRLAYKTSSLINAGVKSYLEDSTIFADKVSVKEHFRQNILNAMRYTIAHEYGHHETLWQTYGTYAETHEIYSEKSSAREASNINAALFNRLDAIAKTTVGLKNAVDIIKRSNDKYSGTWTPTIMQYDSHSYVAPAFDAAGKIITNPIWEPPSYRRLYGVTSDSKRTTSIGAIPPNFDERGVDSYLSNNRSTYSGASSKYLFVVDANEAKVGGQIEPTAFAYLQNDKYNGVPTSKGTPLRFTYSLADFLWAYQLSIWMQEGRDEAWELNHGFRLPYVPSLQTTPLTRKGTVRYALRQNAFGFEAYMYLVLKHPNFANFETTSATRNAIIAALDDLIDDYYDKIIAEYPNFFEATTTQPAMSFYERNLIAAEIALRETRTALADKEYNSENFEQFFKGRPGAYFDPSLPIYQKSQNLLNEDELWKKFGQKDELVTDGTVLVGRAETDFVDYSGSYSEFLTRAWNQFTYRPDMSAYLVTKESGAAQINFQKYQAFESSWIDDTTRFNAQGTPFYRYNLADPTNTKLTEEGGRLLMWFRETLGFRSSLDLLKPLPRNAAGEIDLAALDASLVRHNTFEKVYRNDKTERLSMWGWFTPTEAAKYKYLVFRNADNSKEYVPIKANANTSHYFYYSDLTKQERRALLPGYVQWVADPFIFGKFANATLKVGDTEVYFTDAVGGELVTLASTANGTNEVRYNNDYERIVAEVVLTVTIAINDTNKPRVVLTTRAL